MDNSQLRDATARCRSIARKTAYSKKERGNFRGVDLTDIGNHLAIPVLEFTCGKKTGPEEAQNAL